MNHHYVMQLVPCAYPTTCLVFNVHFIRQVEDIKESRIVALLTDMGQTQLCDLPENAPWTIEEFVDNTQVCTWFFLVTLILWWRFLINTSDLVFYYRRTDYSSISNLIILN